MPKRHCQALRVIPLLSVNPERPRRLFRDHHIFSGNAIRSEISDQFIKIKSFSGRPFQIYLYSRIDHFCAKRKCIDIGNRTINRIILQIQKPVIFRHCTRDRTHQKFGLMHPRVIRPDITVGSIQRAIQYPDIRICDRRFQTRLRKRWRSRKYKIASRLNRRFHADFYISKRYIFINDGADFIRKCLFQMQTSQLMRIRPRRGSRRFGVDERSF